MKNFIYRTLFVLLIPLSAVLGILGLIETFLKVVLYTASLPVVGLIWWFTGENVIETFNNFIFNNKESVDDIFNIMDRCVCFALLERSWDFVEEKLGW